MTHSVSPDGFRRSWDFILQVGRDHGRDMSGFDNVLYHHINVNDDKAEALADSKRFLDLYYSADYSKERLEAWLTYGPPRDCIAQLAQFKASGCRRITFRISTMGDPMAQLRRVVEEVLPYVLIGRVGDRRHVDGADRPYHSLSTSLSAPHGGASCTVTSFPNPSRRG